MNPLHMFLKRPAPVVHARFLELVKQGQSLRGELHATEQPDDVERALKAVGAWATDVVRTASELLYDGSQNAVIGLSFTRHDREKLFSGEAITYAKKLERSGTYDVRRLQEQTGHERSKGLRQTDELLTVLRGFIADVEEVLPAHFSAPRIFFSWQSDSPNNTNRSLIERALEMAIKEVAAEYSVDMAPRLDDATRDAAGAEDIAATILRKIDEAAIFVGDVSIIGTAGSRPTPNPNVLVEAGYAMKSLGPGRVILVLNTATGRIEDLPFDLRPRRTLTYHANSTTPGAVDEERVAERREFAKKLASAIKAILEKTARDHA